MSLSEEQIEEIKRPFYLCTKCGWGGKAQDVHRLGGCNYEPLKIHPSPDVLLLLESHEALRGERDAARGQLEESRIEQGRRKEELDAARQVVEAAKEWADRIAGDERVCGWVHQADYGLYCLLADCGIDFDAALAAPTGETARLNGDGGKA